jgi:hypothetical protein
MIIDYSYTAYTPIPGYLGLGNVWTFNSPPSQALDGPWHVEALGVFQGGAAVMGVHQGGAKKLGVFQGGAVVAKGVSGR